MQHVSTFCCSMQWHDCCRSQSARHQQPHSSLCFIITAAACSHGIEGAYSIPVATHMHCIYTFCGTYLPVVFLLYSIPPSPIPPSLGIILVLSSAPLTPSPSLLLFLSPPRRRPLAAPTWQVPAWWPPWRSTSRTPRCWCSKRRSASGTAACRGTGEWVMLAGGEGRCTRARNGRVGG